MMKYHTTNVREAARMRILIQTGILEYLVTNPSRKAATMNIGIRPIIILTPSFAPLFKECSLLSVPGKRMLLPSTKPAAPDIMMEDISRVPCIQMTRTDCHPNPFEKKKY
jgi:hypothetical protein